MLSSINRTPETEEDHDHEAACGDNRQNNPASETIDQPAHAESKESSDQRRPEIDAREVDAIDLQISKEWFGDESETLCAAGQRTNHRERRDEDI